MTRHSFIRLSKLHGVAGRIDYISNPARQEFLYGVYKTCDDSYWTKLAAENQNDFRRSGSAGTCIEARELIIALPEEYQFLKPNEILKKFTDFFKEKYGVECVAALHHNKRQTNYHIHLIFSERKELSDPEVKLATRNMFYDENGKHRRTKKEVLDVNGDLRKGCYIIPKGSPYKGSYFEPKIKWFKSKGFVEEIKQCYTELINEQVKDDRDKLQVFQKDSIYLPMKKIGKNNPKADLIARNNYEVANWNYSAAMAVQYMSEDHIKVVKQNEVIEPVRESIATDNDVSAYGRIVHQAVQTLNNMLREWIRIPVSNKPEAKSDFFCQLIDYCRAKLMPSRARDRER